MNASEMRERVGRGRIGRIVGGNVHRLHGSDRPLLRAGDPLLQFAHFRRQRRLISDGAGHAAQEGRHFRAGLRESENVVDEQQRIGARFIAEIFRHRQGAERDAQYAPGGSFIWPKTMTV